MPRLRTELEPKLRSDISRAQVARFIRRMAVVSEGDVRLVRVLEDADGVALNVLSVRKCTNFAERWRNWRLLISKTHRSLTILGAND